MNKYYWITKTGERVGVDEMSTQHLRNVLKLLIRRNQKQVGNIEKRFIEAQIEEDANYLDDLNGGEYFF